MSSRSDFFVKRALPSVFIECLRNIEVLNMAAIERNDVCTHFCMAYSVGSYDKSCLAATVLLRISPASRSILFQTLLVSRLLYFDIH